MVSHPKTPILNCLYHLLWFFFSLFLNSVACPIHNLCLA